MPLYDYRCDACGAAIERYSPVETRNQQDCACGAPLTKVMLPSAVIDDSIYEWNENAGPDPVLFTSRAERRLYLKQHNLVEFVRHVGEPGSDRSKHTTRWI